MQADIAGVLLQSEHIATSDDRNRHELWLNKLLLPYTVYDDLEFHCLLTLLLSLYTGNLCGTREGVP